MKIYRELPKNFKPEDLSLFPNIEEGTVIPKPSIKTFKKVLISGFNLFSIRSFKFFNSFSMAMHSKYSFVNFTKQMLKKLVKAKKIETKKVNLWIINDHSFNYFHWITEALPRLALANENKVKGTVLIPYNWKNNSFIKESLNMFDVEYELYNTESIYYFSNLISPKPLATTGNYNPKYIKLVKNVLKNASSEDLRFWIIRSQNQSRYISNKKELIELLKKYNIATIKSEELDFVDEMNLFSKASFIGGLHGAGLTNMVLMDEGSSVLEVKTISTEESNAFFALASALNHNYYYFRSKDSENDMGINLNLEKLDSILSEVFN